MRKETLALFCIMLIISMPMVFAQDVVPEDYSEIDTGESISVNVKSVEPTILTSNLIEENNVQVFVHLAGTTIGNLLGLRDGIEPLYGGIEIEKVRVRPTNLQTTEAIVGDIPYTRPNKIEPDTLGYLSLTLAQLDRGTLPSCTSNAQCDDLSQCDTGVCIPKEVNLTFSAEIFFDQAERLYSLSQTALILPEDSVEQQWRDSLEETGREYSFFGGRGLVRVKDITSDSADVTVYSNKDLYFPIINAPRPIADLTLRKGQESDYVDLGVTDEFVLRNANFRLTLTDITDPALKQATIRVTVGGRQEQVVVQEGSRLYPGSSWTVEQINPQGRTGAGGFDYSIVIRDQSGNKEVLSTTQSPPTTQESDLLNKVFYLDSEVSDLTTVQKDNAIIYKQSTRAINPVPVNQLKQKLEVYELASGRKIDFIDSQIATETKQTKKKTIETGDTLREVLISTLPGGFFYEVTGANEIELLKFESDDPCDRPGVNRHAILPATYPTVSGPFLLDMVCSSITEYQEVVDSRTTAVDPETGETLIDNALYQIGVAYEQLGLRHTGLTKSEQNGAKRLQLESWQELLERGSTIAVVSTAFEQQVTDLENEIFGDTVFGAATIDDNGQFVFVKLISVQEAEKEDLSSAIISKEGISDEYHVDDQLFAQKIEDQFGLFNYQVTAIDDTSVTVKKIYDLLKGTQTGPRKTEVLQLDRNVDIEDFTFQLKSTDTKKRAHITVTPGTGRSLRSVSNFSVHIPIEPRGIKLNPEKIDDKIDRARNTQEKLQKVIDTMDTIVTYWNYLCLGVFAFVSVKSSFFSSSSQARQDAIQGVDGNTGWNAFCQENSGFGKTYNNFDQCMQDNAGLIQKDIKAAQEARDNADKLEGDYSEEVWHNEYTTGYQGTLDECQTLVGDGVFLDDDALNQYAYLQELSQDSDASPLLAVGTDEAIKTYDGEDVALRKAKQDSCITAVSALNSGNFDEEIGATTDPNEQEAIKRSIATGIYETTFQEQTQPSTDFPQSGTFPGLNKDVFGNDIQQIGKVFKGDVPRRFKVFTPSGSEEVQALTIDVYRDILTDLKVEREQQPNTEEVVRRIDQELSITNEFNSLQQSSTHISSNGGQLYYITTSPRTAGYTIYVGSPTFSTEPLNPTFADNAKIVLYASGANKGLPKCVPHRDGNFIEIRSYTQNNEIDELWYWNVGSDGLLCSDDDILVQHESQLLYQTASPNYQTLVTHANRFVRQTYLGGETVPVDNNLFTVEFDTSRQATQGATSSCFDVMDPQDCKALFLACDPVMCPPSRFNYGGRWQVDNVVESGLFGSVVLGQQTGNPFPSNICLTGVLSFLNYWNSMLEANVECLESAKFEGETVGICDKIRSVYWCEAAVREGAAIIGGSGGLLDFLASRSYQKDPAQGGGEYLRFKENIANVQRSVSFFTTEYASTAFAAFRGRDVAEVGGQLCRQALYANVPGIDDALGQITTPEDPNQFFASLTSRPHAPSQGLEAYQTYYHIYAGVNPNIDRIVYQVYLQNSITGQVAYVTEQCGGVTSSIELGGQADHTVDCIEPEGMDQVCVVINGERNCGFGSVSTSFSAEFLKDTLVSDEVRREINTAEQCFPSAPTSSPSLGSVITPNQYGLLETGVQRVCSLNNPGSGQGNSGDWVLVGTCGQDDSGRSLGSCWLNQDSYSLKDAQKAANTKQYLDEVNFNLTKEARNVAGEILLGPESSRGNYTKILNQLDSSVCDQKTQSLGSYKDLPDQFDLLIDRTIDPQIAAAAQFQKGRVYSEITTSCDIVSRGTPNYEGEVSTPTLTQPVNLGNDVYVPVGQNIFTIQVTNVLSTDIVEVVDGFDSCTPDRQDAQKWSCVSRQQYQRDDRVGHQIRVLDANRNELSRSPVYIVTAEEEEEQERPLPTAGAVCNDCKSGLTDNCDANECHRIQNDCYIDEGYIWNQCYACADIYSDVVSSASPTTEELEEMCNQLNDDLDQCGDNVCTDKFLKDRGIQGECDEVVTGTCSYVGPGAPSARAPTIVDVANRELVRWDNGAIQETDNCEVVEEYYTAGTCQDWATCPTPEVTHWSGAFISYATQEAGLNFPVSCTHSDYFSKIRDNPGRYDCETKPMTDVADLEVGDILCNCRGAGCVGDYNFPATADLPSHCDVIIEETASTFKGIGGNLGQSVKEMNIQKNRLNDQRYFGFITCS